MYLAEAYCMLEMPEKAQECFDQAEAATKEYDEKKQPSKRQLDFTVEQQFNKQTIKEKISPAVILLMNGAAFALCRGDIDNAKEQLDVLLERLD